MYFQYFSTTPPPPHWWISHISNTTEEKKNRGVVGMIIVYEFLVMTYDSRGAEFG